MEKLILRSIMYGADKIPDTWFEKVPGGFYKKQEDKQKAKDKNSKNGGSSRPSTSGSGSGRDRRSRRYSTGEDQRPDDYDRRQDDYRRDDGRQRRDRENRDSYDGGDDDRYYEDDRHRRRHRGPPRRGRSADDDRYGYNDGYGRPPRDERYDDRRPHEERYDDRRPNGRAPYPPGDDAMTRAPYVPAVAAGAAVAGAMANGAAPAHHSNPMPPPPLNTQAANGTNGVANGYVPYGHIYGSPTSPTQAHNAPFSPPPQSSHGSSRGPTSQIAPQPYQQNPYAQEAATAAAAGAAAAATYDTQPSYDPQQYQNAPTNESYDRRYDDRYIQHDENGRPLPPPKPRHHHHHRHSRGEGSPSRDSYDERYSRSSRYNPHDDVRRAKSQGGRGKSHLLERFDTSQKGLGYAAVGAVTGGLVGSEFEKGVLPIAIGAAVGALGANAFEARDRYVPNGVTVDPRRPLNQQLRGDQQDDSRRKEEQTDGRDERRDARRSSGYYSD